MEPGVEGQMEGSQQKSRNSVPGRGNSQCKVTGAGACLLCSGPCWSRKGMAQKGGEEKGGQVMPGQ